MNDCDLTRLIGAGKDGQLGPEEQGELAMECELMRASLFSLRESMNALRRRLRDE